MDVFKKGFLIKDFLDSFWFHYSTVYKFFNIVLFWLLDTGF